MIATPTWIGADSAMAYHTESKDNYYQKEGDLGVWQGKAAETLGFSGAVTEKELEKALWGKDNAGNQVVGVRKDKDGDRKRAALDLTFNAPKSVSVAMELANATGNKELAKSLVKAHEDAVSKGIDKFEKLIQTRETIDGKTTKYRSNNLAVAKFTHTVARPIKDETTGKTIVDPSLHTHAVIMNMTQAKDGSFKAIETGDIFKEYMKLGAQYRMELASSLKDMGYDIRITNQKQAFFEIDLKSKDDDKLLEGFSNRSKQLNEESLIKELKEKYPNKSNSEIKQMAAYHSREWKGEINREAVTKDNLKRAEALGFDKDKFLDASKSNTKQVSYADKLGKAEGYIQNAIFALSEEKSVFSQNDIVEVSGKMAMQENIAPSVLEEALKGTKELVSLKDDYFTTKEILKAEHDLIVAVKETNRIKQPFLKKDAKELVKAYSDKQKEKTGYALTDGQQKATTHILSNKNQVIGIQGDAGVGKTTMLKALNELKDKKTKIIGLSYTGKAANEIELKTALKSNEVFKSSGIESSTVSSFLNKYEKGYLELDGDFDLKIVVDEASMLGTKDANKLTKIAKEANAQLIMIGDEKQFKAIGAGDPFVLLKNHADMKTVDMNEVLRQKDRTLKSAVWALNQYDSKKAFDILDKKDLIQETDKGVSEVVREYFKTDSDDKLAIVAGKESYKDNIILTNTNKTKDVINRDIRARHQHLGNVDKENNNFTVRKSVSLNPSEKFLAVSYGEQKGEDGKTTREAVTKVFLQEAIGELKSGSEFSITNIDERRNIITLDNKYDIDLKENGKAMQAYSEKEIDLSRNEKIVFTKNDKKLGINNGESAIIKDIDEEGNLTFHLEDKNKDVNFNLKDYNYIDYGYAITTMKSQGQTAKNVIAYMQANHQNFNSFYVAATRAEESLKIFTDDKGKLKSFVEIEQTKMNATTLWQQLDKKEQERIERYKGKNEKEVKPSEKQISFANKIASELNLDFKSDNKSEVSEFINTNIDKYNDVLKNAPASQKQLDFVSKIANTLYLDVKDDFTHKDAKEFINTNIDAFKDAMDDRHEHLLNTNPENLNNENRDKYTSDLIEQIGNEKDFDKSFELMQKYNENNETGIFEKMIQTDRLAQTLDIRGMDIANKVLENNFDKEYIDAWGLKDKPYEIAKHVNDFTDLKYQDAKEFAKLDLIEEKSNDKFFEDFEEIDKKVQSGELKDDDEKVIKLMDSGAKVSEFLNETRDEINEEIDRKYLKEEFEEYIKDEDIYNASKLIGENKELFDEFEHKNMEEKVDFLMNDLFEEKADEIIEEMEKRDEKELEFLNEDEEQENLNERSEDEERGQEQDRGEENECER